MLNTFLGAALVLICALPAAAMTPEADQPGPQAAAMAQQAQEQAGWAELEAERRATDGDYEGAVRAQQEAAQDRLRRTGCGEMKARVGSFSSICDAPDIGAPARSRF